MKAFLAGLVVLLAHAAQADTVGPTAQAQDGAFQVVAALTTDTPDEIKQKWDTSRTSTPNFTVVGKVSPGQAVRFLGFVAGMTLVDGRAKVTCIVTLEDADGSTQVVNMPPCLDQVIGGPASDMYLTRGFSFRAPGKPDGTTVRMHILFKDALGPGQAEVDVGVNVAAGGA